MNCPKCSNKLTPKIIVDECESCHGMWFEQGELENIIKALSDELFGKSLPDYVKASLEEAKEIITGPEAIQSEWKDFKNVIRFLQYRLLLGNPAMLETVITAQRNPFK